MTLPANVRVNVQVPFPSLVTGSGPVTVTKINGVWTISLATSVLQVGAPTPGQLATDFVFVWDSIAKTWLQVSLTTLSSSISQPVVPTARLPVAAATVNILATDIEVGIDSHVAATNCLLPPVSTWSSTTANGLELTIFDYTGNAAANNITPTLNGTDTFVQGVTPVISTNFGLLKLRPVIGASNKWYIRGTQ